MVCFSPLSWALLVLVRKRSEKKKTSRSVQEDQGMEPICMKTISMEFLYGTWVWKSLCLCLG